MQDNQVTLTSPPLANEVDRLWISCGIVTEPQTNELAMLYRREESFLALTESRRYHAHPRIDLARAISEPIFESATHVTDVWQRVEDPHILAPYGNIICGEFYIAVLARTRVGTRVEYFKQGHHTTRKRILCLSRAVRMIQPGLAAHLDCAAKQLAEEALAAGSHGD